MSEESTPTNDPPELEELEFDDEDVKKKKSPSKIKFYLLALFLIVFMIVIWQGKFVNFWSSEEPNEGPIYLAVVGPMSGKSQVNGEALVNGINLYIDQINQLGGIDGKPVKLLTYDDQNKPELAKKWALEIAKNSKVLAVIGHYNSSTSLAAAPIYKKYGIPAISGSATADELTRDNNWYFRTIFNNSDQGALLANYVSKVLNYEEANILYDEDAYGSTLATAFAQNAKRIGLEIKHQWHFNSEASLKTSLTNMLVTLSASPKKPGILFLATHSTEAAKTITVLKQQLDNINVPIIGADALSSPNFLHKLKQNSQEQIQPGYYSDGIYITAPLLFDLADERAQDFRYAFLNKYQEEPMITSAMYYDAAMVILDAIRKMLEQEQATTLMEKRRQIKDGLWQLAQLENAIEGVTGSLYFDDNGDVVKPIPIGIYKNGRAIAASRQFQPMQSVYNRKNLLQEVLDNKIIEVNGRFMSQAQVVYVGLDFTDVSELDIQDSYFMADFYLWFRFKGDFDDNNIELINLYEPTKLPKKELISEWHSPVEAGVTTRTYRIITKFKVDLDFHKYPLDRQVLPIYFRHKTLTRNQLIYVVDIQGMGLDKLNSQTAIQQQANKFFSIGGWSVDKLSFFQKIQINDSTLGITEFFGKQQRIEYSQFNAAITINRDILSFILKTLLPVIFLVMLGYVAFFIRAFSNKLGIGTNLILATSLFHLQLVSNLPQIDYLVLIEFFFYLVYILALFIIMIALLTHLYEEDESKKSQILLNRLNLFGRILYPLILSSFVGVIAYQNFHLLH
jgi:branched-chain amino acid transport system substrate-binding protein